MKKVLVVFGMQLMAATLESLFSEDEKLRLINIPFTDVKAMLECVEMFNPDILIVDQSANLSGQFHLVGLLESYPNLRVVIVYPEKNEIRIYEQRVVKITRSSDLIASLLPC